MAFTRPMTSMYCLRGAKPYFVFKAPLVLRVLGMVYLSSLKVAELLLSNLLSDPNGFEDVLR